MDIEEIRKLVMVGLEQVRRGEVAPLDMEAIKIEGRRRMAEEERQREEEDRANKAGNHPRKLIG